MITKINLSIYKRVQIIIQLFKKSSMEKTKSSSLQKESHGKAQSQEILKQSPSHDHKKHSIILGVCAMKKKVQSKPMKQILSQMRCTEIQILQMWQYLDQQWNTWPKVDALICFHSDGFPFLKAWNYVQFHKPFLINSLDKQQLLWDRTVVYEILRKIKVPVAKHYFIFRDEQYLDKIINRGNGKLHQTTKSETIVKKVSDGQKKNKLKKMKQSYSFIGNQGLFRQLYKPFINDAIYEEQEQLKAYKNLERNKSKAKQQKLRFDENQPDSPLRQKRSSPDALKNYCDKRKTQIYKYQVEQADDHLLIKNGDKSYKLKKPFVEKPFDSENHEICVYYPESMGGGRKKLFRKIKDVSSQYQLNQNTIRKDGNYIYQEFLPTNAFDIKVYTIGPYYMYAEARRSPTLDGVVQRNQQGKQVRYQVILTPNEKFICNRIVQEFGQYVCGFDLLRAEGKSYVCDVNGWSFVKGNPKYWSDCSTILKKKIFHKFFPTKNHEYSLYYNVGQSQKNPIEYPIINISKKTEELRSIVSIFRHGDRSPKLKLKIKTKDHRFLQFFKESSKDEIKFKDPKHLIKILQITINIIAQLDQKDPLVKDYLQMKFVLEEGGHFQGFNRKVQLKVIDRAQKGQTNGKGEVKKVLLVLKWGGELSYLGYQDAIQLGKKMRMERYDDHDCLSLYSSYRHDLKTYSSDQGRCIKTAAAFLKGFLSIEGQLAPIISSMVAANPKAQRLLDCTSYQNHSSLADKIQQRLFEMMNKQEQLMTSYMNYLGQNQMSQSMKKTILHIGKPRELMKKLQINIQALVDEIERIFVQNWYQLGLSQRTSHHQDLDDQYKCEDITLVSSRWSKIRKDFYNSQTEQFNISKIPQIYDTLRHDLRKNSLIFNLVNQKIKEQLLHSSKTLAYFVVINEYGITDEQRINVAKDICLPLLEKILIDLMFWKEKSSQDKYWKYKDEEEMDNHRNIRTRLYFTSASHIYSLINILRLGDNRYLIRCTPQQQAKKALNMLYMGYLSHIEFRLYENLQKEESDPNKFRLEISFSAEYKNTKQMKEFSLGNHGLNINQINRFILNFFPTKIEHSNSKQHKDRNKAN